MHSLMYVIMHVRNYNSSSLFMQPYNFLTTWIYQKVSLWRLEVLERECIV